MVVFLIISIISNVIFLALMAILKVSVKVQFVLNGITKSGYYVVKLYKYTLIKSKVYLLDDYTLSTMTDKSFLMSKPLNREYAKILYSKILDSIYFSDITLYIEGGKSDDAFFTAMTIGSVYSFIEGILVNTKKIAQTPRIKIVPIYDKDKFLFTTEFKVKISYLNAITKSISALFEYMKQKKNLVEANIR